VFYTDQCEPKCIFNFLDKRAKFKLENKPERRMVEYVIPGKLDRVIYYLLGLLILTIVFLLLIENLIDKNFK
jgi:hypothetical protein